MISFFKYSLFNIYIFYIISFFIKILPPIFSLIYNYIKKILYLNLFIYFLCITTKKQQDNYKSFFYKMYIYSPTLLNIIIY